MSDKGKDSMIQLGAAIFDFYAAQQGYPPLASFATPGFNFLKTTLDSFTKRKFQKFFSGDEKDLEKLKQKIDLDSSDFWEHASNVVAKMDKEEKAEIGNRLLKSMLDDRIDLPVFQSLVTIVERTFLDDLKALREEYERGKRHKTQESFQGNGVADKVLYEGSTAPDNDFAKKERLAYSGLLIKYPRAQRATFDMGDIVPTFDYVFSVLGEKLAKYGFTSIK